jgi:hypothetical protein
MVINIVPFYPVRVLSSEDYFNSNNPDLIYAFGNGKNTDKVRYFQSPLELCKAIPYSSALYFNGMTRQMIATYLLVYLTFNKDRFFRELTPHTSFGKYAPWGNKVDIFPLLTPILKNFDRIRAISPYELDYYKTKGFRKIYYEPLNIDVNYFKELSKQRTDTGVLCMGGNCPVKNVKTIIKACSIAKRKLTILDDVFPGSKEYRQAFIDNDIFVNSSYMEGYPLGVAEAQASGMKLCLANLPTLKSIYNGKALFHNSDDYEQLAYNIRSAKWFI